jgi:outer membrane protein TolC
LRETADENLHMTKRFALLLFITYSYAAAQSSDGSGATSLSSGSIATPRPINPATGTTNPSARATQSLNPYLGSTPEGKVSEGEIRLSLEEAVSRGLKFNLGLIDSNQASVVTRAERRRSLAALLPQISARAQQTYENVSFRQLGLKLPPIAGFSLPATSGGFGYSDLRVAVQSPVLNVELLDRYRAQKGQEAASELSTKDARDVVVFAVGAAYFQVVASQARLATARAALASAREVDRQVSDQYKAEVSPEIDMLRAQVELSTAEQRVVNATNDLEKDKLTLNRITGLPRAQAWVPSHEYEYTALPDQDVESENYSRTRADLQSARQSVGAAEYLLKAARAQRLPVISFGANYASAGLNPGNYNQVYSISGAVSVPLFTGGRIRADVQQAEAVLAQRRAEYQDLVGRVDYDVHIALLDAKASESAVKVAAKNKGLAERALTQSQDRYANGVTNYLEVVQAQESVVAAGENYIGSLFSFNIAKISLARALGASETRLASFFGAR